MTTDTMQWTPASSAVTDQGLMQRFAQANAQARTSGLTRLVEEMPEPWPTYREHVERAVNHIWGQSQT